MSSSLPMALHITDPSPFNDTPSAPSQASQHRQQGQQGAHQHQRRQQLQINTQDIQPTPSFAPHLELQHRGEPQAHDDSAPSPVTSVSATSPTLVQRPPSVPATRTRSATTASSQPKKEHSPAPAQPDSSSSMTSPPKSSTQQSNSPTATTTSTAPTGGGSGTGKRKRSRVTPEQLAYLERVFAMDRSPGAAKRKEISELLGMQERQTQVSSSRLDVSRAIFG